MENIDLTKIKHQLEVTLILNLRVVEVSGEKQTRSLLSFAFYSFFAAETIEPSPELEMNITGETTIHY